MFRFYYEKPGSFCENLRYFWQRYEIVWYLSSEKKSLVTFQIAWLGSFRSMHPIAHTVYKFTLTFLMTDIATIFPLIEIRHYPHRLCVSPCVYDTSSILATPFFHLCELVHRWCNWTKHSKWFHSFIFGSIVNFRNNGTHHTNYSNSVQLI